MRGRRALLLAAGTLCLGLAALGLFLPLLPATPFLLVAAYCLARSHPGAYRRLLRHPTFGPMLEAWREHRAIPRRAKASATLLVVPTFTFSIILLAGSPVPQALLGLAGTAVLAFIWTRPNPP